jgi:hypothetical protein
MRRLTVSLTNIVRPSRDQVGPLVTIQPTSTARVAWPSASKR